MEEQPCLMLRAKSIRVTVCNIGAAHGRVRMRTTTVMEGYPMALDS